MCGIAGIIQKSQSPVPESLIQAMGEKLAHRGPDAAGVWINGRIGFAHRRLKVLDLSDAANQPFRADADVLVFNGEIYNHTELRDELQEVFDFSTRSDTEVLYRALQHWGEKAVNRLEGQFAFAFYDARADRVLIGRDHVGICPLYIYEDENMLAFSSEISPLLLLCDATANPAGILDFLAYRYNIQNNHTLFSGIQRFPPSHILNFDVKAGKRKTYQYWRLRFSPRTERGAAFSEEFSSILTKEVERQVRADVDVGLLLSGGIDSSAILATASVAHPNIRTITIALDEEGIYEDDAVVAVETLKNRFSFNPTYLHASIELESDLINAVRELEDPFGDFIICANRNLAKSAAGALSVLLSGEGGDEAFFGYDHQHAYRKYTRLRNIPGFQTVVSALSHILPPSLLCRMVTNYPGHFGADEVKRIQHIAAAGSPGEAYTRLVRTWGHADLNELLSQRFLQYHGAEADEAPVISLFEDEPPEQAAVRAEIEQLTMVINLLKQDRYCMAASIEGRVPLASKAILEFAASLPTDVRCMPNKPLLREISGQPKLRKQAFTISNHHRHIQSVRILFERWVSKSSVEQWGVFDWSAIQALSARLASGSLLAVKQAMTVVVLMIWLDIFRPRAQWL